jgi:hypothetical protein
MSIKVDIYYNVVYYASYLNKKTWVLRPSSSCKKGLRGNGIKII